MPFLPRNAASRRLVQAVLAIAAGFTLQTAWAQQTTTPTPGNTPMEPTQSGTGAATGAVIDRTASGVLGVAGTASAPRDRATRRASGADRTGAAASGNRGRSEGSDVPAGSQRGSRTGTGAGTSAPTGGAGTSGMGGGNTGGMGGAGTGPTGGAGTGTR